MLVSCEEIEECLANLMTGHDGEIPFSHFGTRTALNWYYR